MEIRPSEQEWANLRTLLAIAKEEDLGTGDVTSQLLPQEIQAHGQLTARHAMIFCGGVFLEEIAHAYDQSICVDVLVAEGQSVAAGDVLAKLSGPACNVMAAERVILNFLQRLSGIATLTGEYVACVKGTTAGIYDTRKTTPGWRELEKYAVRAGGGCNHRRGLYDAVLIKDNHLAVLSCAGCEDPISKLAEQFEPVRKKLGKDGFIEIEVDTMEQYAIALNLKPDIILLDNMSADIMSQAVEQRDQAGLKGTVELEASGGITLANLRAAAETGVERIAIGAVTHSAQAVDIGLDIEIG